MENLIAFGARQNLCRFFVDLGLKSTEFKLLVNLCLLVSVCILFDIVQTLIDWLSVIWSLVINNLWLECAILQLHLCLDFFINGGFLGFDTIICQVIKELILLLISDRGFNTDHSFGMLGDISRHPDL